MIGVALLRDDELLRSIGWIISREEAADLVVESVFGLDPHRVRRAAHTFLRTASVRAGQASALSDAIPEQAMPEEAIAFIASPMRDEAGALYDDVVDTDDTDDAGSPWNALENWPGFLRATRAAPLIAGLRVLWIDDHPEWVAEEIATLRQLGARVRTVRNTREALGVLRASPGWRLIVSDIRRGRDANAGVSAIQALHDAAPGVPIIFFVGDYDPSRGVPPGALGITNRTDELLHLLVDVVEGR
jgi:CheY-like chemotaxis protein